MKKHSKWLAGVSLALVLGSSIVMAEEPVRTPTDSKNDPARIDRDGKRICGFDLMTQNERDGYRNMLHQNKSLADRDVIRVEHCERMRARAKERGVPLDE